MSNFAEIDENKKVIRVLVGDNNDPVGDEGYSWFTENLGGTWIQTSYNSKIRYNYAGIGYTYDPIDDAFIAPMPECGHNTLLLNDKKRWECSDCEANLMQSRTTA
jgi:hypothetical protein